MHPILKNEILHPHSLFYNSTDSTCRPKCPGRWGYRKSHYKSYFLTITINYAVTRRSKHAAHILIDSKSPSDLESVSVMTDQRTGEVIRTTDVSETLYTLKKFGFCSSSFCHTAQIGQRVVIKWFMSVRQQQHYPNSNRKGTHTLH